MRIHALIPALVALAALCSPTLPAQELPAYQDRTLSPEERAADLVSRLTIEEKASLLMNTSQPVERLGIKGYNWWNEALHGVARNGAATTFPEPTGMAASFDDSLLLEVFTAVSDEGRVKYRLAREAGNVGHYQGLTYWTPNVNIFRDPRWGRGMETYGEDPYLTGRMGMAVVRGLQGADTSAIRKAHACAKHYAVHSGPESQRHSFDAVVSERDLRETYLPAFKGLVTKAGVEEVMVAYNRFRGKPCGASDYLIDSLLRGEWGFKGIITSDCWAIPDFYREGHHEYVADEFQAAALGVRSGVDTECGDTYVNIPEAVSRGLLDERYVDRNLIRLLADRYRLGEMDGIDPWEGLPESTIESPEHKALALRMAEESIVLLQNRGGVLPLRQGQRIALVGPNADDAQMMWGNYNPEPTRTITLKEALAGRFPGLTYTKGCGILGYEYMPEQTLWEQVDPDHIDETAAAYGITPGLLRRAVENARKSKEFYKPALDVEAVLRSIEGVDVVVFAGGISPSFEGEEMPVSVPGFEGGDRTDIELPAVQRELLKALHEAGKKVVLVNFSGGAMGLGPETETCDAIVQAWYPGQMGGEALARVLCGDVAPSGKLPVTFYESASQLPEFTDYDMAHGFTYRYFRGEPTFSFGHGLSYTSFKYGRPRVRGGHVTVKVRNTGKVDATEVVQLYVRRPSDTEGPIKTLRGFVRVSVPAGKCVKVSIPIDGETFTWWDEAAQDMVPSPGKYVLSVGGSSADKALRSRSYRWRG